MPIDFSVRLPQVNAAVPTTTDLNTFLGVSFDNAGTPQLRAPSVQNLLDDNLGTWVNALTGLTFSSNTKFFINNAGVPQAIRWGDLRPVVLTAVEDDLLDPLVTSEIQNATAQSLDINISFNDFNVDLTPDTTQRFYSVTETVSGSPVDLMAIRTRTDTGGGTSQVGIFATELEVQATTAIFRNGLGVVGGELDLVGDLDISGEILQEQPNVGTPVNEFLLAQNRYYLASSTAGNNFITSNFYRNNTGEYFTGGEIGFKQAEDYSDFSNSSSEFQIYNANNGAKTLGLTVDQAGNVTATSYTPFTGAHIATYNDAGERLPGFQKGLIVDITKATPNPDDYADGDYQIALTTTQNSKRAFGVLLQEKVISISVDDIYSEDVKVRGSALKALRSAKKNKLDFFKAVGIDEIELEESAKDKAAVDAKGLANSERSRNQLPSLKKPAKLNRSRYDFYVYLVGAVGEGSMTVCNVNGNTIEAGEYISSYLDSVGQHYTASNGQKDTRCVAKTLVDVDFNQDFETDTIDGRPVRLKQVPVTYQTG